MSLSNSKNSDLSTRASQLSVPVGADPTHFLAKVELGRLMHILLYRSWVVLLLGIAGAVALYAFAARLPKIYRASGSVYVSSQAPLVLDIRAVAPEETRDLEQMRSVEQGMSASSLLMRMIDVNHLDADPAFAPQGSSPQALLGIISQRVKIELRRGTRIIDIHVDDTDPARAKRLVESLVEEYQKSTNDRQKAVTQQASEGLAREEGSLREQMEASARRLQEFREAHPVPGLEGTGSGIPVRDALATLSAQLTEATSARLRVESEFEAFAKFDPSNPEALAGLAISERGTEVLNQLKAIQQKEADFGRVKERYLFKHPVYKGVSNEIALMKTNLADTVRSAGQALEQRYRVAQENELKLSVEVGQARDSAVDIEGIREQFRGMSRDAEADRKLHDSVAVRLRETSLAASVPPSVLRWEDTPLVPEISRSPRKIVFAAVGAFVGFLGGLVLLVALELGDRRVRDPAAAARATSAPLLAKLPEIAHSGDGMVLLSDPSSAGAEAFRRLRAILAPPPGGNARTVLFASARAGEGKSFCALNYASSLAMQGHRTLLLDADLRRPGLSRLHLAEAAPDSGLGGYLDGKIDPADACFTTVLPNLYMLSSGPMRADAGELLAGTRFPALLEDAYRWFDRVVIDSPSVFSVSDTLAITRYADRTCLVVRDGGSDRRELKRAADLIRSAGGTLVGFIWNEFPASAPGSSSSGPGVQVNRPVLSSTKPAGVVSAPPSDTCEIVPTFA
jgi:capsular exopolysaccharide synthesis family protein